VQAARSPEPFAKLIHPCQFFNLRPISIASNDQPLMTGPECHCLCHALISKVGCIQVLTQAAASPQCACGLPHRLVLLVCTLGTASTL